MHQSFKRKAHLSAKHATLRRQADRLPIEPLLEIDKHASFVTDEPDRTYGIGWRAFMPGAPAKLRWL